jgi:hypothetical protein
MLALVGSTAIRHVESHHATNAALAAKNAIIAKISTRAILKQPNEDKDGTSCWAARVGQTKISGIHLSESCNWDGDIRSTANRSRFARRKSGIVPETLHWPQRARCTQ